MWHGWPDARVYGLGCGIVKQLKLGMILTLLHDVIYSQYHQQTIMSKKGTHLGLIINQKHNNCTCLECIQSSYPVTASSVRVGTCSTAQLVA